MFAYFISYRSKQRKKSFQNVTIEELFNNKNVMNHPQLYTYLEQNINYKYWYLSNICIYIKNKVLTIWCLCFYFNKQKFVYYKLCLLVYIRGASSDKTVQIFFLLSIQIVMWELWINLNIIYCLLCILLLFQDFNYSCF